MKGILLILALALGSFLGLAFGQTSGFHVLANTIGDAATSITSNSWMPGIKKILGGIQVSVFNHRIVRANLTLWAFNARNNVWDCGTLVEGVPKIVVGNCKSAWILYPLKNLMELHQESFFYTKGIPRGSKLFSRISKEHFMKRGLSQII